MARFFASVAVAALLGVPAWAEVSDNKVRIGILNDQTGVYADFGGRAATGPRRGSARWVMCPK